MDARARSARLGDDAEQSWQRARALGERESGTEKLEEAVAAYRAALEEYTRERVPLDWARTQNNLGIALATLGERESGTEKLEEAVAAYRAALEEYTRERVPLDWAKTQKNLGNALGRLGERESGTGGSRRRSRPIARRWRNARASGFRSAGPTTQNNLGDALRARRAGERDGAARGGGRAYRAALEEKTRDRFPLDWANSSAVKGSR